MSPRTVSSTSAIVFRNIGQPLQLEPISLQPLLPDEALIEVHATGICHSDLHIMDGTFPAPVPFVLGHEGAGIVVAVGSDVTAAAPGDKVLLTFDSCGRCSSCTSSHPAYCEKFAELNIRGLRSDGGVSLKDEKGNNVHGHFLGQSSFGQHAIVGANAMVKIPADIDLKLYAPLGCGLQTGAGAILNSLKVTNGSSLAVWGVGSVGLAGVMAGVLAGAKTIIAIDLEQDRLDLARAFGATQTINGKDVDIVDKVRKLSGKVEGVDFALDCTGVATVVENMINSLGKRGRGCSVGVPSPGSTVAIDMVMHLTMAREYIGSTEGDANPPEFLPYLIEQHKAGRFPFEKIIKHYPAKDFQAALDDMLAKKTIKPILVWSH